MVRFKIKLKFSTSNKELWIPITAQHERQALQIAYDRCILANNSFSPTDDSLTEISQEEYEQMISKSQT